VAILLTGDVGADVEQRIVARLSPARLRVLKVGHHGSRTSSSATLVDTWRPHVALVSSGRGNRFGHPAVEVLQRLHQGGAVVYRTDRDGAIHLSTDGHTLVLRTVAGSAAVISVPSTSP
jgi:competence protein ComEC